MLVQIRAVRQAAQPAHIIERQFDEKRFIGLSCAAQIVYRPILSRGVSDRGFDHRRVQRRTRGRQLIDVTLQRAADDFLSQSRCAGLAQSESHRSRRADDPRQNLPPPHLTMLAPSARLLARPSLLDRTVVALLPILRVVIPALLYRAAIHNWLE